MSTCPNADQILLVLHKVSWRSAWTEYADDVVLHCWSPYEPDGQGIRVSWARERERGGNVTVVAAAAAATGPASITLAKRFEKASKRVEAFNKLCAPFATTLGFISGAIAGLCYAYQYLKHFFEK